MESIFHMHIEDWYDKTTDLYQNLLFSVLIKVEGVYYTVHDQTDQDDFYFRLPLLSPNDLARNVSIIVVAQDRYEAISTDAVFVMNIINSVEYNFDWDLMIDNLNELNFTNNVTALLYASHTLYFAMPELNRLPIFPGVCALDTHCSLQGRCLSETGIQRCLCN